MRRFSLKKLFLILFVLLFLFVSYSFFTQAPRSDEDSEDTVTSAQYEQSPSVAAPADTAAAPPAETPVPTPEPTEVPELVVTDQFEIILEENEELGGF